MYHCIMTDRLLDCINYVQSYDRQVKDGDARHNHDFAIDNDLAQTLPDSIVRVRGVLPFAKIGNTLLVATLNPFDDALRQQVESAAGSPCRFFLANPRTMETTLDRIFADESLNLQEGEAPREA